MVRRWEQVLEGWVSSDQELVLHPEYSRESLQDCGEE